MDVLLNTLTETELEIVRSTDPEALTGLDEDALLDLHGRVRRARNKHLGRYRRSAATRVGEAGGRGKAYAQNQRARDKAEVFESALARVSTAVAKAARHAAAELKAERLAAARSDARVPRIPRPRAPEAVTGSPAGSRPPRKSTGGLKRDASDIAIGRRNQVRRDDR